MRIFHLLVVAAIAGCAGAVSADPPAAAGIAQAKPAPQIWLVGDTKLAFTLVPIAFPTKAGVLTATEHGEASHQGENLDNVIQYRSPDQAVFGTIYIYYPGLPHAGLAALAEDWAIRSNSSEVTGGDLDLGPAGGVNGVAVRASYSHYRGKLASAAAYIKAGRWIVTIRVSGPEARKAEVDAAMQALLETIEFGPAEPARTSPRLHLQDCAAAGEQRPAKIVSDPQDASMAATGLLASFDGAGIEGRDDDSGEPRILPSRVPTELCRTWLQVKGGRYPLLRAADGDPISVDGRSVRLVLLSDSGKLLEVDHAPKLGGYVLLFHDLGETDVLGTYDTIPSDRQLADILDGADREGGRIRVPVKLRPGHGAQIMLPSRPPAAAGGPSAQPAASSR